MLTIENKIPGIGNTPLIDLSFLASGGAQIFAKCEFMNPGMSMKDRIAQQMIKVAIKRGDLKPRGTIICASSGNTGCSVAMIGASMGFAVIVVATSKCSEEKLAHIRAYGAKVIIAEDLEYMDVARKIADENGYYNIDQYSNPDNPQAYYETLGPEIWQQTQGKVTHFVMTGSTFGCITGTSRYLKERNSDIKVILADPDGSNIHKYYYQIYRKQNPALKLGEMGKFIIEGAGKSKPTSCLDCSLIDEVYKITDQQSVDMCYRVARESGILVGGSSGLNLHTAATLAGKLTPDNLVVTILCDNGVKYLSKIYSSEFLQANKIVVPGMEGNALAATS